jgi:hypothetical protein
MAAKLDNLGYARVFRHPRTGKLVVDTDSLRRPGNFSGAADFGADRYDDEDDDYYDDEDDEYDDEDEFEGDDFGDDVGDLEGEELGDLEGDELGDVEGDDFGARGRRRRRRLKRRLGRLNRREARTRRKLRETRGRRGRKGKTVNWGMTAVGGTDHVDDSAGGAATVKVRLQHHFRALDVTFTGSVAGAKVTSIFFGDRVVWSNSDGIDTGVFASTGFLRGLLKGQSIRAGLDVIINGTVPTPGDFSVTLIGQKPIDRC